jgi:crotonobetaine/carnitine-CoA ligase
MTAPDNANLYDGDWVLSSVLADRADHLGDRVFIHTPDTTITYGELAQRAGRFAAGLGTLGVRAGDRVATMLEPTPEYLTTWFGISWAGAVDVPINTEFKGSFLAHVLRESGAEVLVIDARWLDRLEVFDVDTLRDIVVVGEPADPPGRLRGHSFAQVSASDPMSSPVSRTERDLVYIMYTSGTTGPSKGVMLPNRTALFNARSWIDILELTDRDVAYSMFPIFHVTARSAVITSTMWAGGSVALRNGFSLSGFWDDVRSAGATWFGYMGAIIHLLHAANPLPDDADNPCRIAFGAAAPPGIIDSFEKRFAMELIETYGSTELGPASAPTPGTSKRGTMGRVLPQYEIQIQDPATGEPVHAGVDGEICARPREWGALFAGYWERLDATVAAFRDLWFHTGDRGHLDDEGYLVFVDRLKDSMRRRGENISSFEVERAIQEHPSVLEAAAYAVPSELTEDEVMISVVAKPGAVIDPTELFEFCAARIPRFAVPTYLRLTDDLPKTPSQRIQKFKLRELGVTDDTFDRRELGVEVPRS